MQQYRFICPECKQEINQYLLKGSDPNCKPCSIRFSIDDCYVLDTDNGMLENSSLGLFREGNLSNSGGLQLNHLSKRINSLYLDCPGMMRRI